LNFMIGMLKDKDNDGVPDKRDSCRKVFGVLSNKGCPYGFLGESMNNENEITKEAPSFEVVPADSVSDKGKKSEKSVENQPLDESSKSETAPSEIKETKSEIKENIEEIKTTEKPVANSTPTTQNFENASKPSTIDANVDSNKSKPNSEVKMQNKKSDKYNSKVKELSNIMKK